MAANRTGSPTSGRPTLAAVPPLAAAVTIAVGVVVLLGWVLDVPLLRTFFPGATNPMVASTAFCFVLAGGSLWLLRREDAPRVRRWLGVTLAVGAGLVGLLKLGEYAFGWDLGIDQILFTEDPGAFPGQMAVPTAASFVLVGAALSTLDLETRHGGRPAQVVAGAALVLPTFGLIGRLYDIPSLSNLVSGTVVIALHTAVTFLVLTVGVLVARPNRGSMRIAMSGGPGGYLIRQLLPTSLVLVVLAGWLRLRGERAGFYGTEFGTSLLVILTLVLLFTLISLAARSLYRSDLRRLAAEDHVRRSEEQFRAVAESSADAIITISSDGLVRYLNPGAEAMFGYERAEVVGKPVSMLMPEQYRRAHQEGLARYLATGEPRVLGGTVELEGMRKDGVEFPLELALSTWSTGQGRFFTAVIRDTTVRKAADRTIRRAHEEAERANQAKSEFLSRMSHELRTPLNAVLGFGQLLEMEELEAGQQESVRHILKGGRHLLDLINEVLDISRIETGRLALSMEPVPVADVVRESMDLVRPLANERGITLEAGRDALGDLYMLADRQRLKQVLLNLLSNAVKYNRDRGRVIASCRESADGGLRLEVSDTGPGIGPDRLDRLFTPFDRLGAEGTGVEGTGLGLALTKGLVEAMGGALGVASEEGLGTTFWVELSRTKAPVPGRQPPAPLTAAPADDRPFTLLYVEDNVANLELVERALARRPHVRLLTAMQGSLGLDLARQHRPDLILLDLHLPDLSGEEVLRMLRGDPDTASVPVVIVSADATHGQAERLLDQGARSYLTKPLDLRRLLSMIDTTRDSSLDGRPAAGTG